MTNFVFDIPKLSLETDLKQVSYILNKYSEFNSRQKYPKMWKITDVLTDTKYNKDTKKVFHDLIKLNVLFS